MFKYKKWRGIITTIISVINNLVNKFMNSSKIYIGLNSNTKLDADALIQHIQKNKITHCCVFTPTLSAAEFIEELVIDTTVTLCKEKDVEFKITIQATEDANISTVNEMTFVNPKMHNAINNYLEMIGIKSTLFLCDANKKRAKSKLSKESYNYLLTMVLEKFKKVSPECKKVNYSKLCANGFKNEIGLEKYGYKKLIDLLEDLDYFNFEHHTSSLIVVIPETQK